MQFKRHYTREEAQALLPQVRQWLKRLLELQAEFERTEKALKAAASPGRDLGGDLVNRWVRVMSQIHELIRQFRSREIQIKRLDRPLIDFPAMIGGKEVFLCWEEGEDDIEFWHDLESGYAGREKLE